MNSINQSINENTMTGTSNYYKLYLDLLFKKREIVIERRMRSNEFKWDLISEIYKL